MHAAHVEQAVKMKKDAELDALVSTVQEQESLIRSLRARLAEKGDGLGNDARSSL